MPKKVQPPAGTYQEAFEESIKQFPRLIMQSFLTKKIEESGRSIPEEIIVALSEHVLSRSDQPFTIENADLDEDMHIVLSNDDAKAIEDRINTFLESDVKELVNHTSDAAFQVMLRQAKTVWPALKVSEGTEKFSFEQNLRFRWGVSLDRLGLLLAFARDYGGFSQDRRLRSRSKKNKRLNEMLLRFHTRACRVMAEIITLLETGYADGAMARWRTLHEINVVARIIAEFGESIAERYHDHQDIEAKRSMEEYMRCYELLGFKSLSKREVAMIERNYGLVVSKYGADFRHEYGWAALHLGIKKPSFRQLEEAAGQSAMRSYYKMASDGVHAGPRSAFRTLGHLRQGGLLAGASNAGIEEPGQNAAVTLVDISVLLAGPQWTIDDIAAVRVMAELRDQAIRELMKASRKLNRDDTGPDA